MRPIFRSQYLQRLPQVRFLRKYATNTKHKKRRVAFYSFFCYIFTIGGECMAKCSICGKHGIFLKIDIYGRCSSCADKANKASTSEELVTQMNSSFKEIQSDLEYQDNLLASVWEAREQYKVDNDIDKLIAAYEYAMIEAKPPLKNAQSHTMYLAELYIKNNQNDKAWGYLNSLLLPHKDLTHKIRFLQCKILKKEKRFVDAMIMLMMGHLFKAQISATFAKDAFIKEATPIANKLGLNNDNVEYLAYLIENQVKHRNYDAQILRANYKKALSDFGIPHV